MRHHKKYDYVKKVIDSDLSVLLCGPAGSGKSTMAIEIAKDLNLTLYTQNCTKQTTVNQLLGFISINGNYIPSQLRQAFENGCLFLLDEIDAADPNVLLCLNTIENGFISFPDKIVQKHDDFRLVATANPQTEHNIYTGRSNLDFSTRNRYFEIEIDRDNDLELSLTDSITSGKAKIIRDVLQNNGSSIQVTMRDVLRYHKLEQIFPNQEQDKILFKGENELYEEYKQKLQCEVNFTSINSENEEPYQQEESSSEQGETEFPEGETFYMKDIISNVRNGKW